MNNDKLLNETGKKVFEELKKHSEEMDKIKKTQTYESPTYLLDSELAEEQFQQQDGTLQENLKKVLEKFRSENIQLGMEFIEHEKND